MERLSVIAMIWRSSTCGISVRTHEPLGLHAGLLVDRDHKRVLGRVHHENSGAGVAGLGLASPKGAEGGHAAVLVIGPALAVLGAAALAPYFLRGRTHPAGARRDRGRRPRPRGEAPSTSAARRRRGVLGVRRLDPFEQVLVGDCTRRALAGRALVVGRRRDPERAADELDGEALALGIDERAHPRGVPSSSFEKNTEAASGSRSPCAARGSRARAASFRSNITDERHQLRTDPVGGVISPHGGCWLPCR